MGKKKELEQGYKKIDELNEKIKALRQELEQTGEELIELHKKLQKDIKNPDTLMKYQLEMLAINNRPQI